MRTERCRPRRARRALKRRLRVGLRLARRVRVRRRGRVVRGSRRCGRGWTRVKRDLRYPRRRWGQPRGRVQVSGARGRVRGRRRLMSVTRFVWELSRAIERLVSRRDWRRGARRREARERRRLTRSQIDRVVGVEVSCVSPAWRLSMRGVTRHRLRFTHRRHGLDTLSRAEIRGEEGEGSGLNEMPRVENLFALFEARLSLVRAAIFTPHISKKNLDR